MGTAFVISIWILEDVTECLMRRRRISSRYDPKARAAPIVQITNRTYLLFAVSTDHSSKLTTSYLLSIMLLGYFPVF